MFGLPKNNSKDIDIGILYDTENNEYRLINAFKFNPSKRAREISAVLKADSYETRLVHGNSEITREYVSKIKFDFTKSNDSVNMIFLKQFLIYASLIKEIAFRSILTKDMINEIWNNPKLNNDIMKGTLLMSQNVLRYKQFVRNLSFNEKWIVFTQNNYRTPHNMSEYKHDIIEHFAEFLFENLTEAMLEQHEEIYTRYKNLMLNTLNTFYPTASVDIVCEKAKSKVIAEIASCNQKLKEKKLELKAYNNTALELDFEEKLIIQKLIEKIKEKEHMLDEMLLEYDKMLTRIENYFYIKGL